MSYTIHPAAELFPLIEGAEFDSLVADIQANGLIEPIAIQGNVVLDGRNRLRACEAAGIAPRYQEVPKGADAVRYIIGRNVHRRHLSTAQRSAIAAELANLNKLDNLKQSRTEGSNDPSTGTSIEEAAELMNVGTASVKRAKKVMRNDPAAHAAAKAGKKPKAPKAPRFSTVDIYHEAGLIPSAKSGQQSKVLNAEVERLAPGAIAAKDEVRVRTAAERIAMQRQPRAVAEAAKVAAEETKVAIPPSAQQRLEAAIRAHKRVLDAEFEERVQERVTQLLQETVLPKYVEEHERYTAFNDAYRGVLTRDEYRRLLNFVHPDRHQDEAAQKKAAALFSLLQKKEELLCGLSREPGEASSLPSTVAELLAKRRARA